MRVDVSDAKGYTATGYLSVGGIGASPTGTLTKDAALEVSEKIPAEYNLAQNYPNPFNPSTEISYAIKEEGFVEINVYDVLGKVVATLVNENKPAGYYTVNFDAGKLSSGIYFYTIKSGNFFDRKKMILMK